MKEIMCEWRKRVKEKKKVEKYEIYNEWWKENMKKSDIERRTASNISFLTCYLPTLFCPHISCRFSFQEIFAFRRNQKQTKKKKKKKKKKSNYKKIFFIYNPQI